MQLRPYQERAIAALRRSYQTGRRAPCLVLPTGGGKTIVAAAIIASGVRLGTRTLFVADRCTLIDQTVAKLAVAGISDPRVIQAERDSGPPDAHVTVASAQTLRTPGWQSRLPDADLVIWDECHGVAAKTYADMLGRYPGARLLGLTATPCRGDNKPLDMFDDLVVGATAHELIALGHLVPPHVLRPPTHLKPGELAMDPVEAYRRFANARRTAVFCSSVDQAQEYGARFDSAGCPSVVVTAKSSDRAGAVRAFAEGAFRVLLSVGTLTQGWDDPGCGVAILARNPDNLALWIQICGRVLRPCPGKTEGLILDLCGAVYKHGNPDSDQEYSLTGRAIRSLERDSVRQCVECGSFSLVGPSHCQYCGAAFPVRARNLPRNANVGLVDDGATPRREYVVGIVSKYPGRCTDCNGPIRRGDEIWWATVAKKAKHKRCAA